VAEATDRWLTPAQAGRLLGCTGANVRYLAKAGRLRCRFTPLGRLIDARSLERLREKRARSAIIPLPVEELAKRARDKKGRRRDG